MSKKYNVEIMPAANRKLGHHIEFLARASKPAAKRLYSDYQNALKFLEKSPESCPPYITQKLSDANLKYKLFGNKDRYRIVFEMIDNNVFAYDIQDCRQGTDKSFVD